MSYKPIRDYAVIGNLRSAVLVSKDASIDWAPAPFIDSPSVFAALLDDQRGGFWSIQPNVAFTSDQWYEDNSNILITRFTTETGVLEVTDFIPMEQEKTFVPAERDTTFKIHRKVSCIKGVCNFTTIFQPRFDYARGKTTLALVDGGVYAKNKEKHGSLAAGIPFVLKGDTARASSSFREGDSVFLIFRYNAGEATLRDDEYEHHEGELQETRRYWENWVHRCDVVSCPIAGEWHDTVVRSSLVLKILFFEPVGTIAAAPTTSLPEAIGGVRNWDYRFTWIRDSAFTLAALFRLGYIKEAEEYVRWIIGVCQASVAGDPDHLQVMYGLRGEEELDEVLLTHLSGYENSQPVRIGNGAYSQRQLDIYGSILDMVWTVHKLRDNHTLNKDVWAILRQFANHVARVWEEPDEGLWEIRADRRHFVYSKVMCWVALDRALAIAAAHDLPGERDAWKRERERIREVVFTRGWSDEKNSFVQSFDSDVVDASALTFSTLGFVAGDDPRMLGTIDRIERELGAGEEGFLYRYNAPDGLPGKEGAFLFASFWLVDALIKAGKHERAKRIFGKLLSYINHVGLLPEEIDPDSKAFLGNFPQAYTHIGLINSAFNLADSA